ncbi:hypothetical protein ACIBQX_19000 [Nonomuraea sp. NPDC049714]|uniref:hypothetical protein n=1 Tax=Nonomuraea sp. NPDC049714 TaxID=3364357 RepID=UPI00378CDD00
MTTILAEPTTTVTSVPGVLYAAADHLQTLRHARVGSLEIHQALHAAGTTVEQAQDALNALHARMPARYGLNRTVWRLHRDEAASLLRRAADMMHPPAVRAARVAAVLRTAARYVAQPVNASLPDALRTVTRDELLVGEAVEALARRLRCHPRDVSMWDRRRTRAQVGAALADAALLVEHDAAAVTR